jgi:hypothetical protein
MAYCVGTNRMNKRAQLDNQLHPLRHLRFLPVGGGPVDEFAADIFPGVQHGYMMQGSPKAFDPRARDFSIMRAMAILEGFWFEECAESPTRGFVTARIRTSRWQNSPSSRTAVRSNGSLTKRAISALRAAGVEVKPH